jgi:hypothetical protein
MMGSVLRIPQGATVDESPNLATYVARGERNPPSSALSTRRWRVTAASRLAGGNRKEGGRGRPTIRARLLESTAAFGVQRRAPERPEWARSCRPLARRRELAESCRSAFGPDHEHADAVSVFPGSLRA